MLKELFRVDPPILELLTTPIHRQVAHLSQHMYPTTLVMCNFVNCMPYESVISDVDWVAAFAEKKEEEEKNRKMKVSSFSHRNCGSSM